MSKPRTLDDLRKAAERAVAAAIVESSIRSDRLPGCKFPHCGCNPTFKACEFRDEK